MGLKRDWNKLVKLEPRLQDLLNEARAVRDDKRKPSFCANRVWYGAGGLKNKMCRLVGEEAQRPIADLRTHDAYDTAYQVLYHALPDCRNCICF